MSILDIVLGGDRTSTVPILRARSPEWEFNGEVDPVELARDLTETMLSLKGIGLSACQVGISTRLFVIASDPVLVCFNPKIVDTSPETTVMLEGCLSFPGLMIKVRRPGAIRCRFTMPNGDTVTQRYGGLTARIFQHELDHLDGTLFMDRANRFHRDQGYNKWKIWKRRNEKHGAIVKAGGVGAVGQSVPSAGNDTAAGH